eukprot:1034082-Rhodomonas_salina.1
MPSGLSGGLDPFASTPTCSNATGNPAVSHFTLSADRSCSTVRAPLRCWGTHLRSQSTSPITSCMRWRLS